MNAFISIVIHSHNLDKIKSLQKFCRQHFDDFEIIIPTFQNIPDIDEFLQEVEYIRVLQVSQKLNQNDIYNIAINFAIGDFTIVMDEFDEFAIILKSLEIAKTCDIVLGFSNKNQLLRTFLVSSFLKIFKNPQKANSTGFVCLSRRAMNSLMEFEEKQNLHLKINLLNFKIGQMSYNKDNQKPFKQSMQKLLNFLLFSPNNFNITLQISLFAILVSIIASIYTILQKMFNSQVVEGWATLMLSQSLLFLVNFLILFFLSQHLLFALSKLHKTNLTIISEKLSQVLVNQNRLNVKQDSEAILHNTQIGRRN